MDQKFSRDRPVKEIWNRPSDPNFTAACSTLGNKPEIACLTNLSDSLDVGQFGSGGIDASTRMRSPALTCDLI